MKGKGLQLASATEMLSLGGNKGSSTEPKMRGTLASGDVEDWRYFVHDGGCVLD